MVNVAHKLVVRDIWDLLGVSGTKLDWPRLLSFAVATFMFSALWVVVGGAADIIRGVDGTQVLSTFGSGWWWLRESSTTLAEVAIVVTVFRAVKSFWLALPAIVVGYLVLARPLGRFLLWKQITSDGMEIPLEELFGNLWSPRGLVTGISFIALLYIGLSAVGWIRSWRLGLVLGLIGASVAQVFVSVAVGLLLGEGASWQGIANSLVVRTCVYAGYAGALVAAMGLVGPREQVPEVTQLGANPVRKSLFVGGLAVCQVLLVAILVLMFTSAREMSDPLQAVTSFLVLILIVTVIEAALWLRLVYVMWFAIQDGHTSPSPGRAVGLLFMPIFGFYWFFRAIPGYVGQYNRYCTRHGIHASLESGLFVAFAVASVISVLPVIGYFVVPISAVLQLFLAARICDAINQLPRSTPSADLE